VKSEVVFLRGRVRRLEAEAEIARRLAHLENEGPLRTRIWRFIERESEHLESTASCRVCGVSRSAYYGWLKKGRRAERGRCRRGLPGQRHLRHLEKEPAALWRPPGHGRLGQAGNSGQRQACGPPHGPARDRGHLRAAQGQDDPA